MIKINTKTGERQKGYIALISVLIINAIVLLIVISSNLLSISESDMGTIGSQSSKSYYLSNACAEVALLKLKNNLNYSGSESIIVDGTDACDILAIGGSGNLNRTVKTESAVGAQKRKIKVEISRVRPQTQIASWQEVSEF